jgi:hypothetical protein
VEFDGATARLVATTDGAATGAAASEAFMRFTPSFDRRNDRRVSATFDRAELGDDGALLLRVDSPGRRVELVVSARSVRLFAPGIDGRELDVRPCDTSGPHRYGVAAVDGEVRVYVDGRQAARLPYAEAGTPDVGSRAVSIGVRGGSVTVSDVKVDEDIYYESDGKYRWNIPPGCYVMLGDHTGSSNDSRLWKANVVTLRDGTRLVAADKVRLDDGDERTNFRKVEDRYEFIDSDGVERRIPVDDAASVSHEHTPYVQERDLIGRAFFVFFPFPPFGDFRPQLLP